MTEAVATSTRDYTGVTTEQIIIEMLKENTGSHMLDSGGAYGRHWSRNATRDVTKNPAITGKWSVWDNPKVEGPYGRQVSSDHSIGLFHWMHQVLEFDPEMQARLDEFMAENENFNYLQVSEAFADHLHDNGELDCKPRVINTYNDPDYWHVDQTLQYTEIALDGEGSEGYPSHLIVNVHGGCDVRGGYTSPKVFKVDCEEIHDAAEIKFIHGSHDDGSEAWDSGSCLLKHLERHENNLSLTENPLALPVFYAEDFTDTAEIQATLLRIKELRPKLADGEIRAGATPPEETLASLAEREKELLEELPEAAAEAFADNPEEEALFFHEGRLFLMFEHGQRHVELNVGNFVF